MPSTPSSRLGLQAPLSSENANGPDLAQLLIDRLEVAVGMVKLGQYGLTTPPFVDIDLTPFAAANFRHLKLIGSVRSDVAGAGQYVGLRANFDTTAGRYDFARQYINEANAGGPFGGSSTAAGIDVATINHETNVFTQFELDVFDYRNASAQKMFIARSVVSISNVLQVEHSGGRWNQNSVLTALRFYNTNGANGLDAASRIDAYAYG
jgi:hypothetical protein